MSPGKIAALVLAIVVGLGVIGSKLDLFGKKFTIPETAALSEAMKLPALASFTPEQRKATEKLAVDLCTAMRDSNNGDMIALQDFDGLLERTFSGFQFAAAERIKIAEGAKESLSGRKGGILDGTLGGNGAFLRLADIHGQGAALIRVMTPQGAIVLAYLMPKFTGSEARLVDVFLLATGTFISETMRDVMIPMIGSLKKSGMGNYNTMLEASQKLMKARQSGDNEKVITTCESLPPELRKRPAFRTVYLEALMNREDTAAYQRELVRILREEPDSVTTSFKLMDLYLLKKNWSEAAAAALKVEEFVGGEGYLRAMAGMCLSWAGDFEEAARLFDDAEKMEPEMVEVLSFRLHLDCARGDFPAMVRGMEKMKEKFSRQPTPELLVADYPKFQEFIDSAEYKQWKESSSAAPPNEN